MPDLSALEIDFSRATLVAAKRFTLGGVEYNDGDIIDNAALPDPRRARRLFELRYYTVRLTPPAPARAMEGGDLGVASPAPAKTPEKAPQAAEKPAPATPGPASAKEAPAARKSAPSFDPAAVTLAMGYRAEHMGFGKYRIKSPSGDVPGEFKRAQILHLMG